MYKNNYKNLNQTSKSDLEIFLQLIADTKESINFYAIGGTAMVLMNIKSATKDIDFYTDSDITKIRKIFSMCGLREEQKSELCNIWYLKDIRIDIFYGGVILGVPLQKDYKEKSILIKKIVSVNLLILNWFDILSTKLARSEERDIIDILDIINSQNISFIKFKKYFEEIGETSIIQNPNEKLKYLEEKWKMQNY